MKIAFITSLYAPHGVGGAERTIQTLAEMLVQRGHEASVISLAPDGKPAQGEINGVRTHYVPLANVYWPFGGTPRSTLRRAAWHVVDAYNPVMGARVGRILDQEQPDVVQASNLLGFSAAVWRAAAKRNIPVVQMLHDYYLACPNSSMFKHGANCATQCGACKVYTTPRRALSNTPSAVISLSRRMLDRLESAGLFPEVERKVIIHGASSLQPRSNAPMRDAAAPLTVGYLGRMESTKGIEVLLDAALKVPDRQVRVLLGGSGTASYVDALKARYASVDAEFIGFVKPADLFARIDLLVVPSLWEEPLGRVIYEAYAHGVPSIVANAGGMPEIVEEGRTGFVVEPGNSVALAELLAHLASSDLPRDRFRAACLAKSREFLVDTTIDRYLDVWRGAMTARSGVAAGAPA